MYEITCRHFGWSTSTATQIRHRCHWLGLAATVTPSSGRCVAVQLGGQPTTKSAGLSWLPTIGYRPGNMFLRCRQNVVESRVHKSDRPNGDSGDCFVATGSGAHHRPGSRVGPDVDTPMRYRMLVELAQKSGTEAATGPPVHRDVGFTLGHVRGTPEQWIRLPEAERYRVAF